MRKIKQWCDAIRQEDGHKMSGGSLTTLKMIEDEASRIEYKLSQTLTLVTENQSCRDSGHVFMWVSDRQMSCCIKCGKEE